VEGIPVILLDTHVLVWLAAEPSRLSRVATAAIRRALRSGGIAIASISLWEIAALFARGRLRSRGTIEASLQAILQATGVTLREITPTIAALAAEFPADFSTDPADRLIAATARGEGLALVTRDERIRSSPLVRTVW
jgi:PIN domain nuclease of toxin-antitoxin system